MLKFKMSLLFKNAKFRAAVIALVIASIIAGIVYIPRNKASQVKSGVSTQLTSNQIISQAAKLIGKGYSSGGTGFGHGSKLNVWDKETKGLICSKDSLLPIGKFQTLDCTGMIYYTLTSLGCETSGFLYENPVPVDPPHWYYAQGTKKVTKSTNTLKLNYNGTTSDIKVLKANEKVSVRPYYQMENGNEIPAGTVIISNGASLGSKYHDHGWIYIGNLNTSDVKEVAKILVKEYGVDASLIVNGDINGEFTIKKFTNDKGNTVDTIQSTTAGSTHWRIECTADSTGHGVYINNGDPRTDGENQGGNKVIGPIYAYQLASVPAISGKYSVELVKVDEKGNTITTSEATFNIDGKDVKTSKGILTIAAGKKIANAEQNDTYTIKETVAPKGYKAYEGTISLNVQFKKDGNKYVIDGSKTTCTAPGQTGKVFEVSPDNTKITIYVKNTKNPDEPKLHKGVKTVENQNSGYMYEDLKSGKTYTEEQLSSVMHKWVIESSIEEGIEKYKKYIVTDKVDTTKLDFAGLDRVVVTLVDTKGSEKALVLGKDYKVEYKDDVLNVTFIDKDFVSETIKNAKVGSLQGYKFRIVFNTTFKVVDGKLVVLTGAVTNAENKATLTYNNGVDSDKQLESEKPEVHTGAVSVFKYDDANGNGVHDNGEKALVGAEFKIAESKENAEAGKFVKDAEGKDLVAISNEHGVATFTGLEFGGDALTNGTKQADGTFKYDWEKASKDYYIVETKAPKGYLLMSEGVKVTVSKNSSECIDLTDKMEAYANRAVNGTYNFTITKKDAETTKIIEDETTVFDIKVYSKVNKDGTFSEENLVNIVDINGKTINTTNIHAKTNGIVNLGNILIGQGERTAGTYYFVIEETQAPDEYTEIDYRVVVPIIFELKENEYVAKHDTANSYALVKNGNKEVKKALKEMATNNNQCTSTEQVDLTINVNVPNKHKSFDLSLRKFISAVNDVAPEVSREPQVDVSNLASGKSTTATYNHTKEALLVNTTDVVTYTFRMYNEGEIDGYASEIVDDIPEGLEFLPENETNKAYKWVMYKEASEGENLKTIDGKTYVKTEVASEADIIVTDYLKMQNGKANLIKAFNGKTLDYKDVKANFKVVEPTTSERILTNHSQITKHTNSKGTPIEDRDSTPNKWVENEDDQDIENIKVRYFDLSLLKYVTKAIVYENGTKKVVETGHTGYENPEPVVKVDLQRSNIKNVTVKFEYTIKITNEGEIEGYAKEISDYIPEGLKFVAEDNKDWKEVDGKVVTDQLKDTLLQPGESAEVTIILTWINNENNMGVKTNTAEISKDYNKYGTPDIDSTPNNKVPGEDDIDDAPVMLTVRTGMPKQYIGTIFVVLVVVTAGFVFIKKKVIA